MSRRVLLSAKGYRDWWARYEACGLLPGQAAPEPVKAAVRAAGAVAASTRRRSVESAEAVCEGQAFLTDEALNEAPLPPPPWPEWLKLPPIVWGFVSRVSWWFFDHTEGQESRRQAEARAETAADRLIALAADGRDVVVLAHGFFNAMIARVLHRRGWRCAEDGGWRYWAARRFVRN